METNRTQPRYFYLFLHQFQKAIFHYDHCPLMGSWESSARLISYHSHNCNVLFANNFQVISHLLRNEFLKIIYTIVIVADVNMVQATWFTVIQKTVRQSHCLKTTPLSCNNRNEGRADIKYVLPQSIVPLPFLRSCGITSYIMMEADYWHSGSHSIVQGRVRNKYRTEEISNRGVN